MSCASCGGAGARRRCKTAVIALPISLGVSVQNIFIIYCTCICICICKCTYYKHTHVHVNVIYIYLFIYIYYESQPKAWAEYWYKRSEAKLIWGVWGGGGSDSGPFGKVMPEPGWGAFGPVWKGEAGAWLGRAQKWAAAPPFFEAWKRSSSLDTFGCFLTFFIGCQKQKHCNLQCFWAFGMEKVLLATCWKLRKYHCFC